MDKKLLIPLILVIGAMVLAAFLLMGPGPDPLAAPVGQPDEVEEAFMVGEADFSAGGDFDEGFDEVSGGDVAAVSGSAPVASSAAASAAGVAASRSAAVVDAGGDSARANGAGSGSLLRRGSSGLGASSGGSRSSGSVGGTRLAQGGNVISGDLAGSGITAPPSASFIDAPEQRQATIDAIDEAVVTYSPEGLKVLGPLLADPDPAIRAATVEGIIQLGARQGADVLRRAARTTRNPSEQVRMLQAAEFLELPEYQP